MKSRPGSILTLAVIPLLVLVGLLCFFPAFALQAYYPKMKKKHYASLVEAEMPFCLLNIAIELNLGVQFEKALEHASTGKGKCQKELGLAVKEVKEYESPGCSRGR